MVARLINGLAIAILALALQPRLSESAEANKPNAPAAGGVLDGVARTLVKEPKYAASPRYALLVLGTGAESLVWLVEDGKSLYVDKNANGDLTDDGPPIQPTNVRSWQSVEGNTHGDFDYVLDAITPADGARHTAFSLTRFNYGDPEDRYALSFTLDGETPMYAGWFGPFWTDSAANAQLFHFGGPLTPRKLRGKEFVLGASGRLSICFINAGRGEGAASRLSIDALSPDVVPEVTIDWPVAAGASPLRTEHRLTERCCYWEFYNNEFSVPESAVSGTARLTISLPEGTFPFELTTNELEVPVLERQPGSAAE
jgi:hypothetical protein